jgi:hypothetical protein
MMVGWSEKIKNKIEENAKSGSKGVCFVTFFRSHNRSLY